MFGFLNVGYTLTHKHFCLLLPFCVLERARWCTQCTTKRPCALDNYIASPRCRCGPNASGHRRTARSDLRSVGDRISTYVAPSLRWRISADTREDTLRPALGNKSALGTADESQPTTLLALPPPPPPPPPGTCSATCCCKGGAHRPDTGKDTIV